MQKRKQSLLSSSNVNYVNISLQAMTLHVDSRLMEVPPCRPE